jgi:hypothetical protein
MKYKKAGVMLIIYLILFILFVVFFPKTCGQTDYISKTTKFNCQGIEAPFINVKTNYSWCYGICMEKSIQASDQNQSSQNKTSDSVNDSALGPFTELKKVLIEKGPILIGIIFLAGILKWIGSLRARKSNLVVYKKV